MAKVIMVQGTMSNAGKSLIVAGLCRIFAQDGYRVAPFKSQNMALNSYITEDGLEMGRAQVMQAEAAGVKPSVLMNPILLKPTNDVGSQVIVKGEVLGNMRARDYFGYKKKLVPTICEAFSELEKQADIIVMEGAGSPAEINLKSDDIVNMGLAKLVDAPVLLVGDIDRGGVFAQLLGTLMLLEEDEKARVKGLIINKFRGDKTILDPGVEMLEERGGVKVAGVVPYMHLSIEDEDSLSGQLDNHVDVTNTDRTFGTILGAEITRQTGTGLPDDTIVINCHGAGGQSFGAFIPKGLTLKLTGDSNDYFGKGLSGGKLIVKVPEKAAYKPEENIIIGNVALYGATSGSAFINGVAGERFAVRNSGAYAVVEGVGEHGCEYMTGGRVVVLGRTGKNFAAGMSGGIAYVLDVDNKLYKNINKAMISIEKVENKYDKKELRDLIEAHVAATGSKLGTKVLDDFDYYLPHFKKLIPNEYKKMITLSAKLEEKGLTSEQAQMEAFYESIGAKH